ncbi:MAG: hypothetical protein ACI841_005033 [Planctomycetota bacterium]|jgi:hypothetical protein
MAEFATHRGMRRRDYRDPEGHTASPSGKLGFDGYAVRRLRGPAAPQKAELGATNGCRGRASIRYNPTVSTVDEKVRVPCAAPMAHLAFAATGRPQAVPNIAPGPQAVPKPAQRAIAVLSGLCIGLLATCVWMWQSQDSEYRAIDSATRDESVRQAAIDQLVSQGAIYDSFPDAQVGRILMPSLAEREIDGFLVATNRLGVRERDYELPKPADVTRVVVLGDSFIMGEGVQVEERCAAHLERFLSERAGAEAGRIECLQIGMGSWNVTAECAYVRRQMSLLRPDLLIQVLVGNDQDDSNGVRGFGAYSSFSSQHRDRADSMLMRRYPRLIGFNVKNWIAAGLDYESQMRYAEGRAAIAAMRRDLKAVGGRYLLMLNYAEHLPCAQRGLGEALPERELTFLGQKFRNTRKYRLSKHDGHWSALANEEVAKLFYALIVKRELLPDLKLPVWDEADVRLKTLHARGRNDARQPVPLERWLEERPIHASIEFESLELAEAAQIHGGVDADGHIAPYASMILDARQLPESGGELVIDGAVLDRVELNNGKLRIFLDEALVGEVLMKAGKPIAFKQAIPAAVSGRDFLSLRIISTDYAYIGDDLRKCRSARLARVGIE